MTADEGCTVGGVQEKRDIPAEKAKRQENIARAQALHKEGMSYKKIAKELGVHETTVRGYVQDPDRKIGITGRKKWDQIQVISYLREPWWARQEGETKRAFEAFAAYRDMDYAERSYRAVREKIGLSKNSARVQEWSKRWRWQERIKAWDAHIEDRQIRAQEKALEEMGARQALMGMDLQLKAMQRLRGDDEAGVTAINLNLVTAREVAVLAETGAKLERLARGAETEKVDNTHRPIEIRLAPGLMAQNIKDPEMGQSMQRELPPGDEA